MRSIAIVPNNSGQIYPGGSIVYTHTITNNGNVIEGDSLASDISLTVVDSLAGFSSAIYWDKNNNGVLDNGDPIINNLDSMTGGTNGANTTPGLVPGASATLFLKVYSPAGATPGSVDSAVITVTTSQGNYSTVAPAPTQATDNSTVIAGFIRLLKEQAIDVAADGTPDSAYSQANITAGAIPGCGIRYKITVTNTGTASVTSVVINDATPAFTTFNIGDGSITPTGTAVFTKDAGATYHECVGTNGSHPANGIAGTISANLGTLNPGQTATVYFEVKIVQ